MQMLSIQSLGAGAGVISSASSCDRTYDCNYGAFPSRCSRLPVPGAYITGIQAPRRGGKSGARLPLCVRNPAYRLPSPLLFWASTPLKNRNQKGAVTCTAALGFEVSPAAVVVLSIALGYAALRTFVYFRMEYIIAAMLGRHVPRGGAKVAELNTRGGKNLYYYPADIAQVVAVSTTANVQLLENQATRAGVPIEVKTQGPTSLGVPSSSMDAVVSVLCLRDIPDKEVINVLREAVRVLKPGKPFIFVESVRTKNDFVGGLLNSLGSNRAATRDLLSYLQEVNLEDVDCEEVFSFVDPHLVGIAKKKLSVVNEPSKQVRKGFKNSRS
ncbi:unnamed protein product [Calypogeia fissa]